MIIVEETPVTLDAENEAATNTGNNLSASKT